MRQMLDDVRNHLRAALEHQKDEMGFNLAALRFVKMGVEERKTRNFVDEEEYKEMAERGRKKRAFATVA